jgi:hypothetical protein
MSTQTIPASEPIRRAVAHVLDTTHIRHPEAHSFILDFDPIADAIMLKLRQKGKVTITIFPSKEIETAAHSLQQLLDAHIKGLTEDEYTTKLGYLLCHSILENTTSLRLTQLTTLTL